jgi:hypothetical protein
MAKKKLYPNADLSASSNTAAKQANKTGIPIGNPNTNPPARTFAGNVETTNMTLQERQMRADAQIQAQKQVITDKITAEQNAAKLAAFEQQNPNELQTQQQNLEITAPPQSNKAEAAGNIPEQNSFTQNLAHPIKAIETRLNTPQASVGETLGAAAAAVFVPAAKLFDSFNSLLQKKKTIDVTTAESALTDTMSVVNTNIAEVRKGNPNVTYQQVKGDIQRARGSLNDLEQTQKGLGKANLRYWISSGKEIEAEIIQKQNELNLAEQALDTAYIEGRNIRAGIK